MFCMLIRMYDITYDEIQYNHSKLHNFIGSWKMVKNTINFYRTLFSIKLTKNKRKPGIKCFVHLGMMSFTLNSNFCNFIICEIWPKRHKTYLDFNQILAINSLFYVCPSYFSMFYDWFSLTKRSDVCHPLIITSSF